MAIALFGSHLILTEQARLAAAIEEIPMAQSVDLVLSKKVVKSAGLNAIGHMRITPVTGSPVETEKHGVRIDIPMESNLALPGGEPGRHLVLRGKDSEAGLLPYEPGNHDVLLGMDFISAFHITMYDDFYILSN